ncbi:hypothetical protein [uncultured Hymenobacter sp.]|uniref:WapI family immunity protein n=1 Tax=uncultured Hymenobacter sp. TaxID=170016 RepID=UPI0035CAE227
MSSFSIKGSSGFIKISIEKVHGFPEETSYFGGYDTTSKLKLKSTSFSVNSVLWLSTGNIYTFYKELESAQCALSGIAKFSSSEGNLDFAVSYNELGHVSITGEFRDNCQERNILQFEILSDQSYLERSLVKLKRIVEQYGDNTGKRLI